MPERRSVIFGATSALAQAVGRRLAASGESVTLVARDGDRLACVAADLEARGASVMQETADLDDTDAHDALLARCGVADAYWLFQGVLPVQAACEKDWGIAAAAFQTNFTSAASLLTRIANQLEPRKQGCIVVVTSVAGDRGRGSNYIYGSAKGALALFAQGLRNRLSKSGVAVLTVKPGFIDTPMTAAIEKKPALLWASADRVAADMVHARERAVDIRYSPWFWRPIMAIVCAIPERLFKRLSL